MADKENKTEEDEVMEYDDLVKFINKSSYRVNVLKDLSDGDVKMPRDIAVDCNILPNHIDGFSENSGPCRTTRGG